MVQDVDHKTRLDISTFKLWGVGVRKNERNDTNEAGYKPYINTPAITISNIFF